MKIHVRIDSSVISFLLFWSLVSIDALITRCTSSGAGSPSPTLCPCPVYLGLWASLGILAPHWQCPGSSKVQSVVATTASTASVNNASLFFWNIKMHLDFSEEQKWRKAWYKAPTTDFARKKSPHKLYVQSHKFKVSH